MYVSYIGPQTYGFDLLGNLLWHYDGPDEGGGGTTAAFFNGQLYVPDSIDLDSNGALKILDAATGALVRGTGVGGLTDTPVLDGSGRAYVVDSAGNVQGQDAATGSILWTAAPPAVAFDTTQATTALARQRLCLRGRHEHL